MNLKNYQELPDGMEPNEVRSLFEDLLAMPAPKSIQDSLATTKAFSELADRQWHTYSALDAKTKTALDEWIIANWDQSSKEMTVLLIGVIGNVGLPKSLGLMERSLEGKLPHSIRREIQGALQRFGSTVGDPYSTLKKNKFAVGGPRKNTDTTS